MMNTQSGSLAKKAVEYCCISNCGGKVFTSTSTMVFKTFACDEEAVEGESLLRADYKLSCNSDKHANFTMYAKVMVLVSEYDLENVLENISQSYRRASSGFVHSYFVLR